MDDKFDVVFHHGGKFMKNGSLKYEGESTTFSFDPDVWSYFIIVDVVKRLGYEGFKELWYYVGGGSVLENRLELLTNDTGAMHMINLPRLNGQVHLFVVHLVSEPEIIYLLENACHDIGEGEVEGECEKEGSGQRAEEGDADFEQPGNGAGVCEQQSDGAGECEHQGDGDAEYEQEVDGAGECQQEVDGAGECRQEVDGGGECEQQGDGVTQCEQQVDGAVECEQQVHGENTVPVEEDICQGDGIVEGHIETRCEGDNGIVRTCSSSGEDGNGDVNADYMEGLVDCDIQEDLGDGNCFSDIEIDVEYDGESATGFSDSDVDDGIKCDDNRGLSDEEWESEELDSGAESDAADDEESYGKFVTFTMPKSMVDYKWDLGTYFAEKEDLLDALKTYAIQNGRNIRYVKNDKKRVRAKYMGSKGNREHKVKLLNSKWLSKRLEKTVRENPRVKGVDIVQKVNRKWNVGVSQSMAYRAKVIASDHVDGYFKEQYKRIFDYSNEILTRNPGSTVQVKVEPNETLQGPIFRRFYVCLKACKDSFVSCRPIIGLDGAFLKGKYGGEMLTVVGRDANDQMLPIAYAIVEVENKATWKWFIELLVEDLGGTTICASFTFMSDQQKGLLQAFQEVLPRVDQRFCVRHLYANFRKQFPRKQLKRLMWKTATATTPQTWEKEMTNIKELNIEAFKYLIKIPPSQQHVRGIQQCYAAYKVQANNKHDGRHPDLHHEKMGNGVICPKIKSRLNKESQLTMFWIPSWSAEKLFEVRHASQTNMNAVAGNGLSQEFHVVVVKFLNLDAEDFIPGWFRKATYEETYSSIVYPLNGKNMWQVTPYSDVFPPKKKALPGRPKKKRRLEEWELVRDETRMRKGGHRKRCGNCGEMGHNRKSCKKSTQASVVTDQTQQTDKPNEPIIPSANVFSTNLLY
ncbi:hypothetical protein V8G54_004137 [Vigna mungo]|uniref:CCHC-type domain-containing protein n=1 Tax=Vigna mungo TaxID=3915 RepID=A0AAQ3SDV9_VIGMU